MGAGGQEPEGDVLWRRVREPFSLVWRVISSQLRAFTLAHKTFTRLVPCLVKAESSSLSRSLSSFCDKKPSTESACNLCTGAQEGARRGRRGCQGSEAQGSCRRQGSEGRKGERRADLLAVRSSRAHIDASNSPEGWGDRQPSRYAELFIRLLTGGPLGQGNAGIKKCVPIRSLLSCNRLTSSVQVWKEVKDADVLYPLFVHF
jgi:hypothetical protein